MKLGVLENLEPKKVFEYFEALCSIPHGSYHCKAISDYCVAFAKERGLFVVQDEHYNVIIKKEASPSCTQKSPLILQGHLDMVCQKDPDSTIDFEKDGLELMIEEDDILAKGTTLGGDDGIAVAYCLTILDDDAINHPPLEVVFTTEEEVGMEGATGLDVSVLNGKHLINIDSEDEGILLSACAGGTTIKVVLPLEYEQRVENLWEISILGLSGGHSGTEIDKNLGNAHKMMGEILAKVPGVTISRLWGVEDQKDNAIPYECHCRISAESPEELENRISLVKHQWTLKYETSEPGILVEIKDMGIQETSFLTEKSNEALISFLYEVKNGVYTMSQNIEGLVESSLNLGVVSMNQEAITFSFGVRSSVPKYKEEIAAGIHTLAEKIGGQYLRSNDYPAWEYRQDSVLRDLFLKIYKEMYHEDMKVEAIHAGLECGIFASKMDDVDIVSMGPNIFDIHTVNERMSIASVKRTWELLLKIIEEFP